SEHNALRRDFSPSHPNDPPLSKPRHTNTRSLAPSARYQSTASIFPPGPNAILTSRPASACQGTLGNLAHLPRNRHVTHNPTHPTSPKPHPHTSRTKIGLILLSTPPKTLDG
ncbi:hypothetical protein DXG01_016607, partial [Tephrocybe rancida]